MKVCMHACMYVCDSIAPVLNVWPTAATVRHQGGVRLWSLTRRKVRWFLKYTYASNSDTKFRLRNGMYINFDYPILNL